MAKSQENLKKRKATGGRYVPHRGRRAFEKDGYAIEPLVGETTKRALRTRGGKVIFGIVTSNEANVADHAGKVSKSKIVRVIHSPANRDYERRGVLTRGAIVETEAGEAMVTSKPTDDGVVNAVLVRKK